MKQQTIVTLDLEGVLVPEIWIAFAEKTGIEKLKLTTHDANLTQMNVLKLQEAQRERGARPGSGRTRSAVVPGACKAEGAGFGRAGLDGGLDW